MWFLVIVRKSSWNNWHKPHDMMNINGVGGKKTNKTSWKNFVLYIHAWENVQKLLSTEKFFLGGKKQSWKLESESWHMRQNCGRVKAGLCISIACLVEIRIFEVSFGNRQANCKPITLIKRIIQDYQIVKYFIDCIKLLNCERFSHTAPTQPSATKVPCIWSCLFNNLFMNHTIGMHYCV